MRAGGGKGYPPAWSSGEPKTHPCPESLDKTGAHLDKDGSLGKKHHFRKDKECQIRLTKEMYQSTKIIPKKLNFVMHAHKERGGMVKRPLGTLF